jgi:hypothetical protein
MYVDDAMLDQITLDEPPKGQSGGEPVKPLKYDDYIKTTPPRDWEPAA